MAYLVQYCFELVALAEVRANVDPALASLSKLVTGAGGALGQATTLAPDHPKVPGAVVEFDDVGMDLCHCPTIALGAYAYLVRHAGYGFRTI